MAEMGQTPELRSQADATRLRVEQELVDRVKKGELWLIIFSGLLFVTSALQLFEFRNNNKSTATQTDALIQAARQTANASAQNATAASGFAESAQQIRSGIDSAVKNLNAQAQELHEARIASDSNAQAAVRQTEANARLDQQAWLGVVNPPKLQHVSGPNLLTHIPFSNTGKTPALDLRTKAFFLVMFPGSSDADVLAARDQTASRYSFLHEGAVPPQSARATEAHTPGLTKEQEAQVDDGTVALYLFQMLRYKDVDGQEHATDACFHLANSSGDPEGVRGQFFYCGFGNNMN